MVWESIHKKFSVGGWFEKELLYISQVAAGVALRRLITSAASCLVRPCSLTKVSKSRFSMACEGKIPQTKVA